MSIKQKVLISEIRGLAKTSNYAKDFLLLVLVGFFSFAFAAPENTLYQVAPLAALMKGVYDGDYTYGKLKQHGDFGLGTFDYLDGEMVAFNGKFYQMEGDGSIQLVKDAETTPFAEVCYFNPTSKDINIPVMKSFKDFTNFILPQLTAQNSPYAIKIKGTFPYLKLRAVLKQDKMGVPLVSAAKNQKVFVFRNVKGYLVGYWFPQYLSGIAVAGFHFHFISDDYKHGGHVLDLELDSGTMDTMRIDNINMYLPNTASFAKANLSDKNIATDIDQAENSHTVKK